MRKYRYTECEPSELMNRSFTVEQLKEVYRDFTATGIIDKSEYQDFDIWFTDMKKSRLFVPDVITEGQAKEFFRDVCGVFHTSGSDAVVSYELIAERMNLTVERVINFCRACFCYGITERQGGGVVI